jgi:hypothetical protein
MLSSDRTELTEPSYNVINEAYFYLFFSDRLITSCLVEQYEGSAGMMIKQSLNMNLILLNISYSHNIFIKDLS